MLSENFQIYWLNYISLDELHEALSVIKATINFAKIGLEADSDSENVELILERTEGYTETSYERAVAIANAVTGMRTYFPKMVQGGHGLVFEEAPNQNPNYD
jgi:hypothetical protein